MRQPWDKLEQKNTEVMKLVGSTKKNDIDKCDCISSGEMFALSNEEASAKPSITYVSLNYVWQYGKINLHQTEN